ncbi:hypothetical protein [Methylobacterium sp. Leaf85]|uniref:hypothetical protein n=1 Tax=Methylobacterium sp. Leaf85 TaxID=1736241 RepID=UPI0012E752F5|nr:hypothetical protein [Methylobacterium sp. Leaf85]
MSFFDTYGPYEINHENRDCHVSQLSFWRDIGSVYEGLSGAIGCYVFGIRYGHKIRPWYVGMTVAKDGFKGEIFQKHKTDIYTECMGKQRGAPVMFLLPLIQDNTGKYSQARSSKKKDIAWLEITLMGFAFRQNPEISNVRDMNFLRNIEVLGLLGTRRGRPFREAQEIRRTLLGAR